MYRSHITLTQTISLHILMLAAGILIIPAVPVLAVQRDLDHRTAAEYGSVAADFDGDGRDDISVKNDGGVWRIDYAASGFGSFDVEYPCRYGLEAIPVPADYDGDGMADLSVKGIDGNWLIDLSGNGFGVCVDKWAAWDIVLHDTGGAECRPVPSDYDGDGRADVAVRCADGIWKIDYADEPMEPNPGMTMSPEDIVLPRPVYFLGWDAQHAGYGGEDFEPVPADYDGDGSADIAAKTDGGWWAIDFASDGFHGWNWSHPGYGDAFSRPVPADYDGDGLADLAVKIDDGPWLVDFAGNGFGAFDDTPLDNSSVRGRPIPGNYNGTAGAEYAVRPDCGAWRVYWPTASPTRLLSTNVPWTNAWRNTAVVSTRNELISLLRSPFEGIVNIAADIDITAPYLLDLGDLANATWSLEVKSCIQLRGTRAALNPGAMLYDDNYLNDPHSAFLVRGHDITIEGLRFRGPSQGSRSGTLPLISGIYILADAMLGSGRNVSIRGNEFWHWTESAVAVGSWVPDARQMTASQAHHVSVNRNYFHQNNRNGAGYGVVVGGGYAEIKGNLFDRNRHAITHSGAALSGYVARYNYVLAGGYSEGSSWNQHFDVHGSDSDDPASDDGYGGYAGEFFQISSNTFRGNQSYAASLKTRPAFMLRGAPTIGAFFDRNVAVHSNLDAAVSLKWCKCLLEEYGEDHEKFNFHATENLFGVDQSLDIAMAGDLDGDGLDDIFLANGTGWWYSSAGRTEWRFLRASTAPTSSVRFGQFDDDPRADVFVRSGGKWRYSSAGTGPLTLLRVDAAPLTRLLFGDFDGNGLTDVIWTDGSQWQISLDARSPWSFPSDNPLLAAYLRVGNFDGMGGDEVLGYANNQWQRWSRSDSGWTIALSPAQTSDIRSLEVADFDWNGDDVARTSGDGWEYSAVPSMGGWHDLPGATDLPYYYQNIHGALFGHFYGDGRADALRFQKKRTCISTVSCVWEPDDYAVFVGWNINQDGFAAWTPWIPMR